MHIAANGRHDDIVEDLIKYGVDVNAREPKAGNTAPHFAAANGDRQIVGLLLQGDADPSLRNMVGKTALHCAMDSGDIETIRLLAPKSPSGRGETTMRRSILVAATLGVLVGAMTAGGVEGKRASGVFAGLTAGRPVSLNERGDAYEINVLSEKFPTGEEVAEVGDDFIVIKSLGGYETRIPITSIRAVVWIHLKK